MQVEISGIQTQVPSGWVDASTFVFGREDASITIDWIDAGHLSLLDHLNKSLAHLPLLIPGFQVESQGALKDAADIVQATYLLERPRRARHMILVRQVGSYLVTVRGKCLPEHFEAHRADFERVAKSLGPAVQAPA